MDVNFISHGLDKLNCNLRRKFKFFSKKTPDRAPIKKDTLLFSKKVLSMKKVIDFNNAKAMKLKARLDNLKS